MSPKTCVENMAGSMHRVEDSSFVISGDNDISTLSIQDSSTDTIAKKKHATNPRAEKKRRLRPEDERLLKIISEKFRHDERGIICQVESCTSKPMKCAKTSNLKRHLYQRHPKMYANLFPNEVSAEKRLNLEAFNAQQDAIELVTVNGYPFSMLNSSGMRGFIESRLRTIRSGGGHAVPINRYDIVKKIASESDRIKNYIAAELHGKVFSIMFDVCTIATLSMLGVNVTYMKGTDVACHSLGTIKIDERHTAVNLAAMIYNILEEYQLSLTQVFSITTDTASNATATSDVLNLIANSKENENDIAEESIFDVGLNDDELDFGLDIENQAELQKIMDNMAAHTQLVNEMVQSIGSQNTSIMQVNHINCGTHVLQLSIKDTFEQTDAEDIIKIVHDMCLVLRTQIVMIEVRKLGCKVILPPIDNATRWNSKFIMVSALKSLNIETNII